MQNNINRKTIIKILNLFEEKKLICNLNNNSYIFYDEPKLYLYSALLNPLSTFFNAQSRNLEIYGYSFLSEIEALWRCLAKLMKLSCLFYTSKSNLIFSAYQNIKNQALDPTLYSHNNIDKKEILGWVEGFNLSKKIKILIPAQLVFTNYLTYIWYNNNKTEPYLIIGNDIGLGCSSNFQSAIMEGIYELISKKCLLSLLQYKNKPIRINLESIENKTITYITKNFRRHNLDLLLFDISDNLPIPTFLCIIHDSTGIGPTISFGTKSHTNEISAVIGSIEEATAQRIITRNKIVKTFLNKQKCKQLHNINIETITLYESLKYLLKKKQIAYHLNLKKSRKTIKFDDILCTLRHFGHEIFYVDITNTNIAHLYHVYRILIPTMQQIYTPPNLGKNRIYPMKTVSQDTLKKNYYLNKILYPHVV